MAGGCEDEVEHSFVQVTPAGCEPILADCEAFRSPDFAEQKFPADFRDESVAWSGDAFFAAHPLHKHIGLLALALPCCGVPVDDAEVVYDFLTRYARGVTTMQTPTPVTSPHAPNEDRAAAKRAVKVPGASPN